MDFNEVISCLETPERREEFITRLKNAGKHSNPFLKLQSSMIELKMNKAPRGIFENTTLQHAFKFCNADECFQNFRLVCKEWKNTVETIRFNQTVGSKVFEKLDSYITSNEVIPRNYFSKYLPLFKKMFIPLDLQNKTQIFSLILQNTKKLNKIKFGYVHDIDEEIQSFIFQIFQKSNQTLQTVERLKTLHIPDIQYPNLTYLDLWSGKWISVDEFQTYFPKALKNMENLEVVNVGLINGNWQHIAQYIGKHYAKHCISSKREDALDILITPIVEIYLLCDLAENKKSKPYLQYLSVEDCQLKYPMRWGWDRYREIFDQCANLKAIAVQQLTDDNFESKILPTLSETNQEIWKERLSYFKSRGIRILDENKIRANKDLRNQLAKEAKITWRFHFW